ncbi:caspase domain-containing protein [Schizophyllum fasciatum]
MLDPDENSEIEVYSTSSASSSSSSLPSSNSHLVRGLRVHSAARSSIGKVRDALFLPIQVATAMSGATFEPSLCTGHRRAVCIGVNYENSPARDHEIEKLDGSVSITAVPQPSTLTSPSCINDTRAIRHYLLTREGFKEENIRLLVDDGDKESCLIPTRENILAAMDWLVEGAQRHDTLFFHSYTKSIYAGMQVEDMNDDEIDGLDEALMPCDYRGRDSDLITDDVIYDKLVKPLPVGCRLTAVVDCCSSGTVLDSDLPFVYRAHLFSRFHRKGRVEHCPQAFTRRPLLSACPDVVFWSGCKDSYLAGDEQTMTQANASVHAVRTLRTPYPALLNKRRQHVSEMLLNGKERQKPQFGTYYPVNMHDKFFITA